MRKTKCLHFQWGFLRINFCCSDLLWLSGAVHVHVVDDSRMGVTQGCLPWVIAHCNWTSSSALNCWCCLYNTYLCILTEYLLASVFFSRAPIHGTEENLFYTIRSIFSKSLYLFVWCEYAESRNIIMRVIFFLSRRISKINGQRVWCIRCSFVDSFHPKFQTIHWNMKHCFTCIILM